MKKLFVALSLVLFVGSVSASVYSTINSDTIEITHQDHKKKKKESCKKGCEKACCTDKKKEECKKGDEKKKCCASKKK